MEDRRSGCGAGVSSEAQIYTGERVTPYGLLPNTTTLFFCGNSVPCMQRMQGMSKRAHLSHTPKSDWKTVTYTRLLSFF